MCLHQISTSNECIATIFLIFNSTSFIVGNVEMAILILWRHLNYYLSSRTATPSGSSFPVTRPSLSLYNRRDPVTEQLKAASRDVLLSMMDDMNERFTTELVRIAVSDLVLSHCSLADKMVLKFLQTNTLFEPRKRYLLMVIRKIKTLIAREN